MCDILQRGPTRFGTTDRRAAPDGQTGGVKNEHAGMVAQLPAFRGAGEIVGEDVASNSGRYYVCIV